MKKLILALLLLTAASASSQTVTAPQIKKKTNGGIVGDSAGAVAVGVYRGTSAPASPVTGQPWCDTTYTPCILKMYNGSTWDGPGAVTILTQDTLGDFPANPVDGQISWVESQKRAIVYSSADTKWYYLDSEGRAAAPEVTDLTYSSAFLTAPGATTGSVTSGGSATTGTHLCAVTYYNATGGETMLGTATSTLTVATNKTLSLTIPTGDANTVGRKIYCTKANTTTPFVYVGLVADNSTTATTVTTADSAWLGWAPPDEDFSAPIDASLYMRNLTVGLDGCGSTGSSIICYAHNGMTHIGGSTTARGPRLEYYFGTGADAWRATMRIVRWRAGFTGNANSCLGSNVSPYQNLGFAFVSLSDTAVPTYYAWAYNLQLQATAAFPFAVSGRTLRTIHYTRVADSAPSFPAYTITQGFYPPINNDPFYIKWRMLKDGSNYSYNLSLSPNNYDWSTGTGYVAPDNSDTICERGICAANEMTRLGLVFEVNRTVGMDCNGYLIEFDGFTFAAE